VQTRRINLTFHGVGAPPRALEAGEAAVWVSRARLDSMLDAVAGRDDVRITFDDGNASDLEHALPALRERGLTAAFFVVAGRVGTPGFVDAAGIRALDSAGMAVGCHGLRHRPWRSLDSRTLERDLLDARATLESIVARPVVQAACPFGSYDRRVLRVLRRCGFRTVYTSDAGTARPRAWIQARNTVGARDTVPRLDELLSSRRSPSRTVRRQAQRVVKRWR
jgi:peptidoglycan/xylan/chitin deacetylase (PgdA/CDA1 family)